jgi:hypothetical protein
MMSFDEFLNRPCLCRECCEEIPADVADVDIDDEGQTVAICDECRAEQGR